MDYVLVRQSFSNYFHRRFLGYFYIMYRYFNDSVIIFVYDSLTWSIIDVQIKNKWGNGRDRCINNCNMILIGILRWIRSKYVLSQTIAVDNTWNSIYYTDPSETIIPIIIVNKNKSISVRSPPTQISVETNRERREKKTESTPPSLHPYKEIITSNILTIRANSRWKFSDWNWKSQTRNDHRSIERQNTRENGRGKNQN